MNARAGAKARLPPPRGWWGFLVRIVIASVIKSLFYLITVHNQDSVVLSRKVDSFEQRRNPVRCHFIAAFGLGCLLVSFAVASDRLTVHEWGTFTAFQNEKGESLRRINTDDEPVPEFVHQLNDRYLFSPTDLIVDEQPRLTQGAKTADRRVTMRLETPVLYFHLPQGSDVLTVDVSVDFRRGLLTQFFPKAQATVKPPPDGPEDNPAGSFTHSGSLIWSGVQVGKAGTIPETTDSVWLAPRKVNAAPLTVGDESERFLFYRGVGDVKAPFRVERNADQNLWIFVNPNELLQPELPTPKSEVPVSTSTEKTKRARVPTSLWLPVLVKRHFWLLDVHADGRSAYRRIPYNPSELRFGDRLFVTPGKFDEKEFSPDSVTALRAEMRSALIEDGLFEDEADALLNTWQLSYFLSPGQRLFFLVPQEWTDELLPLKLSVPADVKRVMVGRIELVTPAQRQLLRQLAETLVPDMTEVVASMKALKADPLKRDAYNALASGRGDSSILGVPVPPTYQSFLDLGRFRTSLILDSIDREPKSSDHISRLSHLRFEIMYPGKLQR